MKIGFLKNWTENYSAVVLTIVLFFLLVLLKLQEDQVTILPEIITSSEIEIASSTSLD